MSGARLFSLLKSHFGFDRFLLTQEERVGWEEITRVVNGKPKPADDLYFRGLKTVPFPAQRGPVGKKYCAG